MRMASAASDAFMGDAIRAVLDPVVAVPKKPAAQTRTDHQSGSWKAVTSVASSLS